MHNDKTMQELQDVAATEFGPASSPETGRVRPYKKIVLTGGPCAGKSKASEALQTMYGGRMVAVPEAATLLFEGGFPLAGRDIEYSEEWRRCAQTAIFDLQLHLETAADIRARQQGAEIVLCDRGILDAEPYLPGLIKERCAQMGMDDGSLIRGYDGVIHLDSLAVLPEADYGKHGNASRREARQEAVEKNEATKSAWESVYDVTVVVPASTLEAKVATVATIIDQYLRKG